MQCQFRSRLVTAVSAKLERNRSQIGTDLCTGSPYRSGTQREQSDRNDASQRIDSQNYKRYARICCPNRSRDRVMLNLNVNTIISIYSEPVDMRKSFSGLVGIIRYFLKSDPLSGQLFVFLNKHRNLMKILYWDGDGYVIWYKRLERGTFRLPACKAEDASFGISRAEFLLILEGFEPDKFKKRKRFIPSQNFLQKNPEFLPN